MSVLELFGGAVVEATVQAPVVVPVDPAGGGPLDIGHRAVRTGVEDGGADALVLVEPDDGLGQGIDAPIGVKQPLVGPDAARAGVAGVPRLRVRGDAGGSG